ncbi:MAG: hypothetical protein KAS19_06310 [Anaerolineales bacterium]|nr:hypothetical protein [Anaerolineales bacterium]
MVKFYEGGLSFSDLENMPIPDLLRLLERSGKLSRKIENKLKGATRGV